MVQLVKRRTLGFPQVMILGSGVGKFLKVGHLALSDGSVRSRGGGLLLYKGPKPILLVSQAYILILI